MARRKSKNESAAAPTTLRASPQTPAPAGDGVYVELGKNPARVVMLSLGVTMVLVLAIALAMKPKYFGLMLVPIPLPIVTHIVARLVWRDACSGCGKALSQTAGSCGRCGAEVLGVVDEKGRLVDGTYRGGSPWAMFQASDTEEYRWAPELAGDRARAMVDRRLVGVLDVPEVRDAHERRDERELTEVLYELKRETRREADRLEIEAFFHNRRRRVDPSKRAYVAALLGTGLRLMLAEDVDAEDGSHIATLFVCVFYVPLVPLRSFLALPLVARRLTSVEDLRGPYAVVGAVPMRFWFRSWRFTWAAAAIAVGAWLVAKKVVL